MPVTGELANQNIKDRYYGENDPVAKKILNRQAKNVVMFVHLKFHCSRFDQRLQTDLTTPDDPTITTLWIGGLDEKTTESDIKYADLCELSLTEPIDGRRSKFQPYGEVSVRLVTEKKCCFVTYATRLQVCCIAFLWCVEQAHESG